MRAPQKSALLTLSLAALLVPSCNFQPFQAQKLESDKDPEIEPGPGLSLSNGIFVPPTPGATPVPFEEAIKPFLFEGDVNDPDAAYEALEVDGKVYLVDSAKWATRDRSVWVDDGPYAVRYVPPGVQLPARPTLAALPPYVTNSSVTVSGTKLGGQAVVVYKDWAEAGVVDFDDKATWSEVVQVSGEGPYEFAARAVDQYGVPSIASSPVSTIVDLSDPFPPVLNRPNGPMVVGENLVVEGISGESGGKALVSFGGATVEVPIEDAGGGSFVHDFGPLPTAGEFPLSVTTVAPSGRRGPPLNETVIVDIPR